MRQAMANAASQGDEWAAYSTLRRTTATYQGWPTAREGHGHGALVVVVGVTPHQGARESLAQGEAASREDGKESPPLDKEEAGQVRAVSEQGGMREADCHNRTDTTRSQERRTSTGKPDAWKAGTSGLTEGPTEKGRKIPRRRPTLLREGQTHKGWATSTSAAAYSTSFIRAATDTKSLHG